MAAAIGTPSTPQRVDSDPSATTTTLATYSNLNAASGYALKTLSLTGYAGKTVTLKFTGKEDSSAQTSFVLDDVAVSAQ